MRTRLAAVVFALSACSRNLALPSKEPPDQGQLTVQLVKGGAPAAGARATVAAAGLSALADASGKATFGAIPSGSYALTAAAADGKAVASANVVVLAGKATDAGQLSLETAGSVRGKATLGSASGNAGVVVFAPGTKGTALTADDGSYALTGLAPGSVTVYAKYAGYALGKGGPVTVSNGAAAMAPDVVLAALGDAQPKRAALSGVAHFETRAGADGAGVTVTLDGTALSTTTDAAGNWAMSAVPEGRYNVRFTKDGHLPITLVGVVADASAPAAVPAVTLKDATTPDPAGHGVDKSADPDRDGDGVPNAQDAFPDDPSEWADADGDGIGDNRDNCPTVFNPDQTDSLHDGVGDACRGNGRAAPPAVAITGPDTVVQGQELDLAVHAGDPGGQAVSLSVRGALPANAAFTDETGGVGVLKFTPDYTQAGAFTFVVDASNGRAVAEATKTVVVTAAASVPLALSLVQGNTTVSEGDLVDLVVKATDPLHRALDLTVTGAPAAATFVDDGAGGGTLTWATRHHDAATYPLVFTATESARHVDLPISLTVNSVPVAPTLAAPSRLAATQGKTLTFTVTSSDPDGTPTLSVRGALAAGTAFVDNGDGTGAFTYTPPASASSLDVTFVATLGALTASASTHVDIYPPVNLPPALGVTGATTVAEGATLTLSLTATDAEGEALSLFVKNAPANAALQDLGGGVGTFTFAAAHGQAGTYTVTFVAADPSGLTSVDKVLVVTPNPGNTPPTVAVAGTAHVGAGQAIDLNVVATDPDSGETLTLTVSGAPPGAVFVDHGAGSGTFHWQTQNTSAGTYTVTFSCSDGIPGGIGAKAATLVVDKPTTPPVLAGPLPDRVVSVGSSLTVNLSASGGDGDPLVFSVDPPAQPGAALTDNHDGTAKFVYAPRSADYNTTLTFTFAVTDGAKSATQTQKVTVPPQGNQPPAWDSASLALATNAPTVAEGKSLTLTLTATDVDGDPVTLTATRLPANATPATCASPCTVTYAPGFSVAAGGATASVPFSFTADDGRGATASLSFTVNVSFVNRPPAIVHQSDLTVGTGASALLVTAASDPDTGETLSYSYTVAPAGKVGLSQGAGASANQLTLTPALGAEGDYTVTQTVTDGLPGGAASDAFTLHVVTGNVIPLAAPANPFIADDVLLLDTVNNQLVAMDHKRDPTHVYLMKLASTASASAPSAQSWRAITPPGAPPGTENTSNAVYDSTSTSTRHGALLLLRNDTYATNPVNDVWRLDLTPGAESWTQVSTTNGSGYSGAPVPPGCFTGNNFAAAFTYDAAGDRVLCGRIGNPYGTYYGAAFKATPGQYAWSVYNLGTSPTCSGTTQTTGCSIGVGGYYSLAATTRSESPGYALRSYSGSGPWVVTRIDWGASGATATDLAQANPAGAPPQLDGFDLRVDTAKNRLLLFGGTVGYANQNAFYQLDLATGTWAPLTPNGGLPPARVLPRLLYVPSQSGLYLGGGCGAIGSYDNCAAPFFGDFYFANLGSGGF